MQRPVSASDDTNTRTAQLVKLISEIGPDIPEISRRLGQFKESVRYRYKEKVLEKGFGVQASLNHEKLGLRRVVLVMDLAPDYKTYAHAILSAMNELCYIVYFEKRMLTDDYLATASVPAELVGAFVSFMAKLREKGVFRSVESVPFDWFRTIPMRTECYDFDTGRWDFDWSSPLKISDEAASLPSGQVKFDYVDLLILKELQIDATRSFVEIAAKLKMNYKMLDWHYKTHVLQRGLVSGYYLRWMGTNYSSELERALHRKHRYQHISLLARGLLSAERMELMTKLHGVPFLWSEMVGKSDYYAEFYFPTEHIAEALQFLTQSVSKIKERFSVMMMDQAEALSFTISYQLFDKENKKWTFNEPMLLSRFDRLVAQIGEAGGV